MKEEKILGIDVSVLSYDGLMELVLEDIKNNKKSFIVAINPEKVLKAKSDEEVKEILAKAKYKIADGIGIVYASKINGGEIKERVTGIDCMDRLCKLACDNKYKVFLYGAKPEIVEKAKHNLEEKYHGLDVCGYIDGYEKDEEKIIETIKKSKPDIIFVALGSPAQEKWIIKNMEFLPAKIYQGVGGSFDVISGSVKRAPKWMQKCGLEWLYRLLKDPKRIFRQVKLFKFLRLVKKEKENKTQKLLKILGLLFLIVGGLLLLNRFSFRKNLEYSNQVAVFAYHHVLPKEEKDLYQKDNAYVLSLEDFEDQMKYLKEHNFNSISMDNLVCFLENECDVPNNAFIISIDDGNTSTYRYILPILEKYEFYSVAFIISSRIGESDVENDPSKLQFMSKPMIDDVRENHKSMVFGSHSHALHGKINDQVPMEALSSEQLIDDLKKSKEILNTDYFCYPFGTYNEKYMDAVKDSGYKLAFIFNQNGLIRKGDNPYSLKRLKIRSERNNLYNFDNLIRSNIN